MFYVPAVVAGNLRIRQTGQIGVILEAVGGSESNSMLDGVSTGAVRRAFNGVVLAGLGGAARDLQVPALVTYLLGDVPGQTLLDGWIDGLIVSCDLPRCLAFRWARCCVPISIPVGSGPSVACPTA